MTCEVCFYESSNLISTRSYFGNWSIRRCGSCIKLDANPVYEIESRIVFGLAPPWTYYLVVFLQSPRSKGGQYVVYSEIA